MENVQFGVPSEKSSFAVGHSYLLAVSGTSPLLAGKQRQTNMTSKRNAFVPDCHLVLAELLMNR